MMSNTRSWSGACSRMWARGLLVSGLALTGLTGACATEHVETRKECNHHCSAVYETCSERSIGGNTLNNCGYENMRCNALCPSK